jgi:hypothetical protein
MVLCRVLYRKALVSCLKGFSDSKVAATARASKWLSRTLTFAKRTIASARFEVRKMGVKEKCCNRDRFGAPDPNRTSERYADD